MDNYLPKLSNINDVTAELNKTLYFFYTNPIKSRFKGTPYVPHDVLDINIEISFTWKILAIILSQRINNCSSRKNIKL